MPGSDVTLDKTAEVVMVHAGDGVTVKDTNSSGALLVGKNDSAYVPTSKTCTSRSMLVTAPASFGRIVRIPTGL